MKCPMCGLDVESEWFPLFCASSDSNVMHVWTGVSLDSIALNGHQRQAVEAAIETARDRAERQLLFYLIETADKTAGGGVWRALFAEILGERKPRRGRRNYRRQREA